MSEFNIEDLDAVIARSREGSLAQMLALQLKSQIRKSEQLAAENVAAKKIISECREYFIAGVMNRIRPTNEGYLHMICDTFADETPATDRIYAGVKAEAKSHDLNAFISHYSAELDAHIESGGDQFDAKSVRLRSFIVGGRMFREKLRDEEKARSLREGAK